MIEREGRLADELEAAKKALAMGPPTTVVRPVITVNVERLLWEHDIAMKLWRMTADAEPGTTVRLVVGKVWPPTHLPDMRRDLTYAVETERAHIFSEWKATIERSLTEMPFIP